MDPTDFGPGTVTWLSGTALCYWVQVCGCASGYPGMQPSVRWTVQILQSSAD